MTDIQSIDVTVPCWCCGQPRIVKRFTSWPTLTTPARPGEETTQRAQTPQPFTAPIGTTMAFRCVTPREKRAWDRGKIEGLAFALKWPDQAQVVHDRLLEVCDLLEQRNPLPASDAWLAQHWWELQRSTPMWQAIVEFLMSLFGKKPKPQPFTRTAEEANAIRVRYRSQLANVLQTEGDILCPWHYQTAPTCHYNKRTNTVHCTACGRHTTIDTLSTRLADPHTYEQDVE